jgi:PHP family Zn ribbon phosphoesterase
MSPINIVKQAKKQKLNIIGITDHNSTLHTNITSELAKEEGILALKGVEVTTKEEAHCLCFFEKNEDCIDFQEFIDNNITKIRNNPNKFGYQVVVNRREEIIHEIDHLLITAINKSIEEIEEKVHSLGGLFIAAHIDKSRNSIKSQLGFVPKDLKLDALGLSVHTSKEVFLKDNEYLKNYCFLKNSDAHYIEDIGKCSSQIEMEQLDFKSFKRAISEKKVFC